MTLTQAGSPLAQSLGQGTQLGSGLRSLLPDRASRVLVVQFGDDPAAAATEWPEDVVVTIHRARTMHWWTRRATVASLPFGEGDFDVVVVAGLVERASASVRDAVLTDLGDLAGRLLLVVMPSVARGVGGTDRVDLRGPVRWRTGSTHLVEIRYIGTRDARSALGSAPAPLAVACYSRADELPAGWTWSLFGRRTRRSLLDADFRNPLQSSSIDPSDGWIRWDLDGGVRLDAAGAHGVAPYGGNVRLRLPLACAPSTVEVVHCPTPAGGADGQVRLIAEFRDGARTECVEQTDDRAQGRTRFILPAVLPRHAPPRLLLVIPHAVCVSNVAVVSPGSPDSDLGVEARPGPNLTALADGSVRLSWYFHATAAGWMPTSSDVLDASGARRAAFFEPALGSRDGAALRRAGAKIRPIEWRLPQLFQTPDVVDPPPPWRAGRAVAPAGPVGELRVLLISHMFPTPATPVSGSFVFEAAKALVASGDVDVRVVCPVPFWGPSWRRPRHHRAAVDLHRRTLRALADRRHELDGVAVEYLPYFVPPKWTRHGDAVAKVLATRIESYRAFDPHVVHAHSGYVDGHGARLVARQLGVPLVVTEHTGPLAWLFSVAGIARRVHRVYRSAALLLGVSEFQASEMRRLVPSVADKVEVQHNGYDASVLRPGDQRHRGASPRLLYVGFIAEGKGLDVLVRAIRDLPEGLDGTCLDIVGDVADSAAFEALEAELADFDLIGRVDVLGGCNRRQVADIMSTRADILVLPSNGETFGCVVAEALGAGLPVVVTDCGGPRDIVGGEPAARLVPIGDHAAMAAAITDLWLHRDDAELSPQSIASRAADRFAYPLIAAQLTERYRALQHEGRLRGRSGRR